MVADDVTVARPPSAPLIRSAWLRIDGGGDGGGVPNKARLRLHVHAKAAGRVVHAAHQIQLAPNGGGDVAMVLTVVRLEDASAKPVAHGRLTGRTQLHFEMAEPARPPPPPIIGGGGATSDAAAGAGPAASTSMSGGGVIFPAQRRAYDAVCDLLHACAEPHAAKLREWRVRPPSGLMLSGPPGTGKTHVVRTAALAFGAPLVAFGGAAAAGDGEESGARLTGRLRTRSASRACERPPLRSVGRRAARGGARYPLSRRAGHVLPEAVG